MRFGFQPRLFWKVNCLLGWKIIQAEQMRLLRPPHDDTASPLKRKLQPSFSQYKPSCDIWQFYGSLSLQASFLNSGLLKKALFFYTHCCWSVWVKKMVPQTIIVVSFKTKETDRFHCRAALVMVKPHNLIPGVLFYRQLFLFTHNQHMQIKGGELQDGFLQQTPGLVVFAVNIWPSVHCVYKLNG